MSLRNSHRSIISGTDQSSLIVQNNFHGNFFQQMFHTTDIDKIFVEFFFIDKVEDLRGDSAADVNAARGFCL